jgi:hypothetical protein
MPFGGRSLIPFFRSTSSASRDLVPSQSRDVAPRQSSLPDHVHDHQQQEPDESRDLIPAPRVRWRHRPPEEERTPTHREVEIRSRDDDRYYPENRYYDDEDHHYPESYHHRHPPPSRYRDYARWDEDPRAAPPVNVNIYVDNENSHEVQTSGNSYGSWETVALIAVALAGLVLLALILDGGHWWYPYEFIGRPWWLG